MNETVFNLQTEKAGENAIEKKIELILTVGQVLVESGAANDKITRVIERVATFMDIPEKDYSLHIMKQIIFLEVTHDKKILCSFRKCGTGIDFEKIYAITKLTWQILKESVSLKEFESKLKEIATQPKNYSHGQIIFAVGAACSGFCYLFGGNIFEAIYTGLCAMAGKYCQITLLGKKVNEFISIAFAAFVATVLAYLFSEESLKTTAACALFLVPGVPIINAVIDATNKSFLIAVTEIFRTLCILVAMTVGIVFAINICLQFNEANFIDFLLMETTAESSMFFMAIAAAICSAGFAVPLNMPKKFLWIVGLLGAFSVCFRLILHFNLGLNPEHSTFIAAFAVGVLSIILAFRFNLVASLLVVPPLLPMIPGLWIYRFLFASIEFEKLDAEMSIGVIAVGIDILQIIFAIVIGAILPRLIAQEFLNNKAVKRQMIAKK